MSFLYSVLLKLLYPTSVSILLLLASAFLRRRHSRATSGRPDAQLSTLNSQLSRICFWSALAVLMICGNGWLVGGLTRHLESQYPPFQDYRTTGQQDDGPRTGGRRAEDRGQRTEDGGVSGQSSVVGGPDAIADCILVLGGGTWAKIPPRPTVEVAEAGDRVLYAAYLFRKGRAPTILCTAGIATGGMGPSPGADTMVELLENLGVPTKAILRETASRNTYEHGRNLNSFLQEKGFRRVLLVTSALHMPRSMGVFRKQCPDVVLTPAPTDYRAVERLPMPWYRHLAGLIPTPSNLAAFSEVMHEYLGIAWYRLRGWL